MSRKYQFKHKRSNTIITETLKGCEGYLRDPLWVSLTMPKEDIQKLLDGYKKQRKPAGQKQAAKKPAKSKQAEQQAETASDKVNTDKVEE